MTIRHPRAKPSLKRRLDPSTSSRSSGRCPPPRRSLGRCPPPPLTGLASSSFSTVPWVGAPSTGPWVGAPAASAAAAAAPLSHRIWRAHACSMSRGARRFEVGPAAPFPGFSCGIHAAATALLSLPPPGRPQFTTAWAMSAPASAGSGLGPGIWQLERIIDGRPTCGAPTSISATSSQGRAEDPERGPPSRLRDKPPVCWLRASSHGRDPRSSCARPTPRAATGEEHASGMRLPSTARRPFHRGCTRAP